MALWPEIYHTPFTTTSPGLLSGVATLSALSDGFSSVTTLVSSAEPQPRSESKPSVVDVAGAPAGKAPAAQPQPAVAQPLSYNSVLLPQSEQTLLSRDLASRGVEPRLVSLLPLSTVGSQLTHDDSCPRSSLLCTSLLLGGQAAQLNPAKSEDSFVVLQHSVLQNGDGMRARLARIEEALFGASERWSEQVCGAGCFGPCARQHSPGNFNCIKRKHS